MSRYKELIEIRDSEKTSDLVMEVMHEWYPLNSVVAFKNNHGEKEFRFGIVVEVENRDEADPDYFYQFYIQDIDGFVLQYLLPVSDDDIEVPDDLFLHMEEMCKVIKTFDSYKDAYHFLEYLETNGEAWLEKC